MAATSEPVSVGREADKLLAMLREGDPTALNELTSALYGSLYRMASNHLRRERAHHTLQATALVNEAYLKLFDLRERRIVDESHFLAIASRAMRQVLVDYARARGTRKRGSGKIMLPVSGIDIESEAGMDLVDLIELDRAISDLSAEDDSLARVVEMRYFGGLTAEETARVMGVSAHTVRHDIRLAQAWLRRRLAEASGATGAESAC